MSKHQREGTIFYKSFYDAIKNLPDKERLEVYDAIFLYDFSNKLTELNGIPSAIFTLIKPQLDANKKRYKSGSKGGRPQNSNSSKAIQYNQNITKTEPNDNQELTKEEPNKNININIKKNINNNNNKLNFNNFWQLYPKKIGKPIAEKSYFKIKNINSKELDIIEGLKKYIKYWNNKKTDKQYIPNPSTWLNQERWNDELGDFKKFTNETNEDYGF